MAVDAQKCAACGAIGDTHEHHLVPRVHGGAMLPTVNLCVGCHAAVHGMTYAVQHKALTRAGLAAAKAAGRVGGNPGLLLSSAERRRLSEIKRDRHMQTALRLLPTVMRLRPRYTWDVVADQVGLTGETLRRRMVMLVNAGHADAAILARYTGAP